MVIRHGLRARRRCRDERGTSLVELLVTMVVGGLAITMATVLFTSMTDQALATQRKVGAEMQARQALADALRYLRNAAPLGSCAQWDNTFDQPPPTGLEGDLTDPNAPRHCLRISAGATDPAVIRLAGGLEFYSYPNGANSGDAPDIITFTVSGTTLTVAKRSAQAATVFEAYCNKNPGSARCPASPRGWVPTATPIASIPISGGGFTFYDGAGNVTSVPDAVRMVSINLDVAYTDAHGGSQSFVYRATVSLRGAQYLGGS